MGASVRAIPTDWPLTAEEEAAANDAGTSRLSKRVVDESGLVDMHTDEIEVVPDRLEAWPRPFDA